MNPNSWAILSLRVFYLANSSCTNKFNQILFIIVPFSRIQQYKTNQQEYSVYLSRY